MLLCNDSGRLVVDFPSPVYREACRKCQKKFRGGGGLYLGKETVRKDKGIYSQKLGGNQGQKEEGKKRLTQAAPKPFLRA